jgi:ParB-like chromosome segregation protein Spo0J
MSTPFSPKQFEEKPNAKMPRTRVRLDKIVATQRKLDPAKVKDIASKPAEEISTDPVVHPLGGKYYVSDGHHRVAGAIERGDTTIKVRRVK